MKQWIIDNLMVYSEKKQKLIIVNKRLLDPYLTKINAIDKKIQIFELTSFLPADRKLCERIHCVLTGIMLAPTCSRVGCEGTPNMTLHGDYYDFCSKSCINKSAITRDKIKNTLILRLGVEYPMQSSVCRKKTISTLLSRYGVDNPSKSDIIKDKKKQKSLDRYGVENVTQSQEVQDKMKSTHMNRYGVDNPQKSKEIRDRTTLTRKKITFEKYKASEQFKNFNLDFSFDDFLIRKADLRFSCKKCGRIIYGRIRGGNPPRCKTCNPTYRVRSKYEDEIKEFIETFYPGRIDSNKKILDGKEIDIFIPDKNIGIEFNGMFWHSEQAGFTDPLYHAEKSRVASEKGILLYHIYEDHWNDCKDIVKSNITKLLGYVHSTKPIENFEVRMISENACDDFLQENSVEYQDPVICLGLFYGDSLAAVCTIQQNTIEFHEKKFITIVGCRRKFLEFIKRVFKFKTINLLHKIDNQNMNLKYKEDGFEFVELLEPSFDWMINENRIHDVNIVELHENKSDIDKMWNCGYAKFEYKCEN